MWTLTNIYFVQRSFNSTLTRHVHATQPISYIIVNMCKFPVHYLFMQLFSALSFGHLEEQCLFSSSFVFLFYFIKILHSFDFHHFHINSSWNNNNKRFCINILFFIFYQRLSFKTYGTINRDRKLFIFHFVFVLMCDSIAYGHSHKTTKANKKKKIHCSPWFVY